MDAGSLIHALLLEAGRGLCIVDADDYRTKDARAVRDAARKSGETPVLRADFNVAVDTATRLRERIEAFGIRFSGDSEVVIAWDERVPGRGEVACRCMMDHLIADRGIVYDVKTIRSANPATCAKHMVDFGYAIQWAAYTRALQALRPSLGGRIDFVFLFCETEPPYCVTPVRPSGMMRQLGEGRWERALETWADCMKTNHWPREDNSTDQREGRRG
jgi:hypothetical protein